ATTCCAPSARGTGRWRAWTCRCWRPRGLPVPSRSGWGERPAPPRPQPRCVRLRPGRGRRCMPDALLHAATLLACVAGMGWLALAMDVHARQAWGRALGPGAARLLRVLGGTALVVGLLLALAADHASMAVLVWVMALAGAALAVAFALAWRPRWLRWLAPWIGVAVRTPAASAASSRRRPSGPA